VPLSGTPRLALAVVNDFPVVTAGVARLLEPYRHRVTLPEYAEELPPPGSADVVLFDPFGHPKREARLREVVEATRARVIVYSWVDDPQQVDAMLRYGAAGYLPKSVDGEAILVAAETVQRGGDLPLPRREHGDVSEEMSAWPGQAEGLTSREAEMICLITSGLTNAEIASTLFLSINSVKTYIRTAYRKMAVTSRSEAVLWGIDHGFRP
jgi:DNA-binding NarL/FixJ family response regulator